MTTKDHQRLPVFEKLILVTLFIILALTVLAQANPGTSSIRRDSGFYIYIGNQILHGKLLYKDVWDHKPPAIYYLDALALGISRGSRWGIWSVEFIFLFIAIVASYILMKHLWGTWPAMAGCILWLYGLELTLQGGNLTEEYPLALHFISILLFLRSIEDPSKRSLNFLFGFISAVNFLFRPNNVAIQIVMVLILLFTAWTQKRSKVILPLLFWTVLGAMIPLIAVTGYFWSKGLIRDLLDAVFSYNIAYSQTPLNTSSRLVAGFHILGFSAWVSLAGYLAAIWLYRIDTKNRPLYLFLLIGTPVTIYLSDPAKRFYPHYWMNFLPFIALLGATILYLVQSKLLPNMNNPPLTKMGGQVIVLVIAILFFVRTDRAQGYRTAYIGYITDEKWMVERKTPMAGYVRSHTQPGDYVLFWGAFPDENFLSNRDAPTKALFYPLYVDSDISRTLNDQFLLDLKMNPPVLIVDMSDQLEVPSLDPVERQKQMAVGFTLLYTPDNLDQVFDLINKNYTLGGVISGKNIYRLNTAR